MESLFEQLGGTYTRQGDYCLPDVRLPPEEERPIGVYGQRRLWCSNHIFFICIIKISKIHRKPPFVKFTGTLWRKKYVPFNEND